MTSKPYRLIDHTADFGIEVFGKDPCDLFTQAGLAVFDLVVAGVDRSATKRHALHIQGQDWPDLMVNWLRELLYLWNGQQRVGCDIDIEALCATELKAVVTTDAYHPRRHHARREIKAVTYHQIVVESIDQGWHTQVIFDV